MISINTNPKKALVLVEGQTERRQLARLDQGLYRLLEQGGYQITCFGTSIYELYDPLIRERKFDSLGSYLHYKGIVRCPEGIRPQDQFSLIYLIFDLDPLYHLYGDDKIRALQHYFSDETGPGLLYINYPMLEAMFDVERNEDGLLHIRERCPLEECSSEKHKSHVRSFTAFRAPSGHPFSKLSPYCFAKLGMLSIARYRQIMNIAGGRWFFSDLSGLLAKELAAKNQGHIYPLSCFPFMALDFNAESTISFWKQQIAKL